MTGHRHVLLILATSISLFAMSLIFACGEKGNRYDTNLLENPSFEEVKGELPRGWELAPFRGLEGEKEVDYGIDRETAYDGENSFYFEGNQQTKKWFALAQELEVDGITHVRLRGALRLEEVGRTRGQYARCNFLLAFFDENHRRFQEMRFADKGTEARAGTTEWIVENRTFRVPRHTRYIKVYCILGMSGKVWFDDLSLEIPRPAPWLHTATRNFDFYWLAERPFPPRAMEKQQSLYEEYCRRLGVTSDARISYYLYPDSSTIKRMLSLKGVFYISWDDQEIHTIQPYEDHEIIHIITDPFGTPPRSICEGTVFYLQGGFRGKPLHPVARQFLAEKKLPSLTSLIDYNRFVFLPSSLSLPSIGSFVAFIVETWGMERLIELYRAAKGANAYLTFGPSFERVYGVSAGEAETRWRQFLARGAFAEPDTLQAPATSNERKID
ncbi:MAG: hypothetical protein GTO51_08890 [Candidatus Latescibacteria bacterium]|nr:hypothetical protein [Candidatus Latescibacterota bacterium]NIM22067.1 hypothetical protein [Candidatus Latescibacterota bacterium]NIM66086.1 hypothetical protein [Candidatus Latescibacterota bacterium]NIO02494.1 hypothetical protein [Candidatus Latescibacterota bacterium]NIO29405.1 hypothetical protein [Candidatus Latescibacterota bacterium]